MSMSKNVKKWVSGVAVASVIVSGATWTAQTASAAATPFSDVVANHWAEKHIAKLALQGILKGSNGKFNPNVSMTRQEAIIVALRFMGIDGQANASDVVVLPSVFNIKPDYTSYINLAIQRKLIIVEEENAIAKSEQAAATASKKTYGGWGSSPATREWISKVLVRAIGKDADALSAASQATSFSDDAKIDPQLKGYVNVAASSGLVKGVASGTTMNFNPKDAVTRATASTLFSRAESFVSVPHNGQVEGILMNITSDKLSVMHSDGKTIDYTVNDNTVFYKKDSDTQIALAALRLYGKAMLIAGADGKVGYVEMIDETPQVKTVEGTLILSSPTKNQLTLAVGDDPVNYNYESTPKITDSTGQEISIANLPLNVPVKLTLRADNKVLPVALKQAVTNKSGSGTVSGWNPQTLTLEVKDAAGKADTFAVSANAPIKLNGTVNLSPDQLLVGDTIAYDVKNGSVTSIVVTRADKPITSATGTLESINKTDGMIVYKADGGLEVKYLSDSYGVKINGFADATLEDLVKGDTVTLSLDANRKVTLITVTNRSVQPIIGAVVVKYDSSIKALTFKDVNGKQITKNMTDATRIDLNGTKLTASSAASILSTPGMRLTIGFNGEDLIYVSFISQYTGVVTENNLTSKKIKLALEGATTGNVTLSYLTPLVETYGLKNQSYSDVKVGDRVTVQLNTTQDQISAVYVHKNVQYEVVSTDATTRKLRVKRPGTTAVEEYTLAAETPIKDDNGNATALSTLAAGSLVNATMRGNTPVDVRAVSIASGKVTSVNAAGGTITFTTLSGETVTKSVGTSPIVKRDGTTLAGLVAVQAGDLIEVSKDENDRAVIEMAAVVNRSFLKIDGLTKVFYVKATSATDKNYYTLHPQVYIHQGATTITTSDLKEGDSIVLYVMRGNVVEIAKQ